MLIRQGVNTLNEKNIVSRSRPCPERAAPVLCSLRLCYAGLAQHCAQGSLLLGFRPQGVPGVKPRISECLEGLVLLSLVPVVREAQAKPQRCAVVRGVVSGQGHSTLVTCSPAARQLSTLGWQEGDRGKSPAQGLWGPGSGCCCRSCLGKSEHRWQGFGRVFHVPGILGRGLVPSSAPRPSHPRTAGLAKEASSTRVRRSFRVRLLGIEQIWIAGRGDRRGGRLCFLRPAASIGRAAEVWGSCR